MIILHEGGFAKVSRQALEASNTITLSPWAAIEGVAKTGREPASNIRLNVSPVQGFAKNAPSYSMHFRVLTDDYGEFRITRVPPQMTIQIAKAIRFDRSIMYSYGTMVDTKSGQTQQVQIGGTGRPVIGKVRVPGVSCDRLISTNSSAIIGTPAFPENYHEMSEDDRRAWYLRWYQTTDAQQRQAITVRRFPVKIREDGTFRVDDVPAGHYQLEIMIKAIENVEGVPREKMLGRVTRSFEMKAMEGGRSDKAQLLGVLKLEKKVE